jgi:N-methylhydantoinase A
VDTYRLGIDIGGTFTDFSLLDEETGAITVFKTPSDPAQPEAALLSSAARILAERCLRPEQIRYFVHGTTLAVNTIIQRKGSRTALLVTKGFRDILNIARHRIPDVFNFMAEVPAPLVPRSLVFEIPERCRADGRIVAPPDEEAIAAAARRMVEAGVESAAICFLHSYRNPAGEDRAREVLVRTAPDIYVCTSSDVWPQLREYERSLAAVMNAYVGKGMRGYFRRLEAGVQALGIAAPVLSTKSNGGVMPVLAASERPVETLMSGPAAGVIGAADVGRTAGFERLITFDMGGTSADVAVIDGAPHYSTEGHVGDFPVIMPAIDVTSIGAGGGSIAWIDPSGALKVGPESAGALPGPACYGLGGTRPTITDAYVALGIISPDRMLGGSVRLDAALAVRALADLGQRLGRDVRETAEAILEVATSQMYSALVPLLARKGIAYEDFTLLAFGGGGPCHAFLLAADIGIRRVLVPLHPGILCAAGSLAADVRKDLVQSVHRVLPADGAAHSVIADLRAAFERLGAEGKAWLASHGLPFASERAEWSADMRYVGQSFELTPTLTAEDLADSTGDRLRSAFLAVYERIYGHKDESAPIEVLDVRLAAVGVNPRPRIAAAIEAPARTGPPRAERRPVFLAGREQTATIYRRADLAPGFSFTGPAIVEQYDTTVFITPGFTATVDPCGNLIGEVINAD